MKVENLKREGEFGWFRISEIEGDTVLLNLNRCFKATPCRDGEVIIEPLYDTGLRVTRGYVTAQPYKERG